MRLAGRITDWDDDKGFGFVVPHGGGNRAFVLHLVDLLGGWPGALIAQQQFRHKTLKPSFQLAFWATVVFNLAGAAWLHRSGLLAVLVELVGGP